MTRQCSVFRLHDYDNNNLLDGVEIMAAISHVVPHDEDLDLGKLGEGVGMTVEQKQKYDAARERQISQMNHFTSAYFHWSISS